MIKYSTKNISKTYSGKKSQKRFGYAKTSARKNVDTDSQNKNQ